MKALQLTLTRPPEKMWWLPFIESVANDPAYAELIASHNTFLAYVDPSPSNNSPLRRRVLSDPDNPLIRKIQWIMPDLPENSTPEEAYIHYRLKARDFILAHNDAPYTETAEESYDGIPRVIPKNLALSFFNNYMAINGFEIINKEIVDIDL